tara:strand:- start:50 stop:307 length:258 start_codon:yes stop_codon:yes gene_type:complete
MLLKIQKIIYFLLIVSFCLLVALSYFSDENKKKINKNRSNLIFKMNNKIDDIPFLQNDTNNIVDYSILNADKEKIKKRYFWELLK